MFSKRHVFTKGSLGVNADPSGTDISLTKAKRSQSTLVAVGSGIFVGVRVGLLEGVKVAVAVFVGVLLGVGVEVGIRVGV